MLLRIKNKIEQELQCSVSRLNQRYRLHAISPLLKNQMCEFISRKGKRIRPLLFVLGYLAYAGKPSRGLYRSALSVEFLHDCMLIHDDIIDKADLRRGQPSMHVQLDRYLQKYRSVKFRGSDLSIVMGDLLFAIAIDAFLSIEENERRKEQALKTFIEASIFTGTGQFLDLVSGIKHVETLTLEDIYEIYDLKTAHYTFAAPLLIGATLAGAPDNQKKKLSRYGIYLGRAFQIKDDILGIFGTEKETGKPNMTDLQEAKKTLLLWHAYQNTTRPNRSALKRILAKSVITPTDLKRVQTLMHRTGTVLFARTQIQHFLHQADSLKKDLQIAPSFQRALRSIESHIFDGG